MSLDDVLVAALATWQFVEILHHSPLFEEHRVISEVRGRFFDNVLSCPWCLSCWVAYIVLCWLLPTFLLDFEGPVVFVTLKVLEILRWPLYALAVSRLANLGNDLTYRFCRTPDRQGKTEERHALYALQKSIRHLRRDLRKKQQQHKAHITETLHEHKPPGVSPSGPASPPL
jgi:hypothetical protein